MAVVGSTEREMVGKIDDVEMESCVREEMIRKEEWTQRRVLNGSSYTFLFGKGDGKSDELRLDDIRKAKKYVTETIIIRKEERTQRRVLNGSSCTFLFGKGDRKTRWKLTRIIHGEDDVREMKEYVT